MVTNEKVSEENAPGGVKKYQDFTDDFVESQDQDITLPDGYSWIHQNIFYRAGAAILYGMALVFTFFYSRLSLSVKVENKDVLKECRGTGYFLYGNHTQPIGDAFCPTRYAFPTRLYTVMGTANLGIPVLGKILPMLGGMPIPDSIGGMRSFLKALQYRIEHKNGIVIYPEAHVWPWCDFVRPYPETSFRYPVMFQAPAFCMTTTYQKKRHGKKPRTTVYLDGPFYPHPELGTKEAEKQLHDEIYACMQERSKNSTYEYIKYEKESKP